MPFSDAFDIHSRGGWAGHPSIDYEGLSLLVIFEKSSER
jgi:hypothetical protein